ncbi:MAG: hypothetical protein OXH24_03790, partial [Cyanobacteria bacterium MAG IRC3_bin_20]|nr:hypothetical protein [Cyanobacteria bacterium MAG IRC3_bin_20]
RQHVVCFYPPGLELAKRHACPENYPGCGRGHNASRCCNPWPGPGGCPMVAAVGTPLVILGVATLFLTQQNRAFDAVNKRIDILREDLRGSETRQREDLREIREDLGRLEAKVDRLLESL